MKLILTENIRGLGSTGDLVKVRAQPRQLFGHVDEIGRAHV